MSIYDEIREANAKVQSERGNIELERLAEAERERIAREKPLDPRVYELRQRRLFNALQPRKKVAQVLALPKKRVAYAKSPDL